MVIGDQRRHDLKVLKTFDLLGVDFVEVDNYLDMLRYLHNYSVHKLGIAW